MRVAMIAPPWLPIPPQGYGGIENVVYGLVPELLKLGVKVELFTTGDSTVKATKKHSLYADGQYSYIHKPLYVSSPIAIAQVAFALNRIRQDGKFDIIHDHNGFIGPLALSQAGDDLPPSIHTLHGPPFSVAGKKRLDEPDNLPMWRELAKSRRFHLVGISEAIMKNAPKELKPITLPAVHNAVDLAHFPFVAKKDNYFATLARFHPEKGQAVAVKLCAELDVPLRMAGVIGDLSRPKQVLMELANPLSTYRGLADFRYYSDKIFPFLEHGKIDYVGEVSGERKLKFIGQAKALLFPIQWDEPFGMAPIEALACGTPVIAMARGALPEIIEHGVNGFLAKTEAEFKHYMTRIDEIDPTACRKSVEDKFSASLMAKRYLERYEAVLASSKSAA